MRNISCLTKSVVAAALLAALPLTGSAALWVGVGVTIAPPAIPVYAQPPCPAVNHMWIPGYWAWGPGGYYWVPGYWVAAPGVGLYWTPGYWGWNAGAYYWYPGYWGPTVGFYGGVNYGFGYFGSGYVGGGWYGNYFRYNTAVTNVNRTVIHNVYVNRTVLNYNNHSRISYNGGHGGIQAHPTSDQIASRRYGTAPTSAQSYHENLSGQNRNHLSTVNHGYPNTPAVQHPFTATHQMPHFTPVTDADRAEAQRHVAPPPAQHQGKPPR